MFTLKYLDLEYETSISYGNLKLWSY